MPGSSSQVHIAVCRVGAPHAAAPHRRAAEPQLPSRLRRRAAGIMVTTIREAAARRRRRGAQRHRARTQQVVVALAAGVGGPSRRARYSNAEKPCRRFGWRRFHDIYRAHRVSMEAFCESQWLVIDAINNHPDYALKFPVDDPEKLSHIEAGFRAKSTGQLHTGCVGAIDGVFIKIRSVAFGSVTFATLGKPATKALLDVSCFNAGDPTIPTRTSTQGASGAAGSTRTA